MAGLTDTAGLFEISSRKGCRYTGGSECETKGNRRIV